MSGRQMEASIRTGIISNNNNGFLTMTAAFLDANTNNYKVDLLYSDIKSTNTGYTKYYKEYKIPVSIYRDEAIFNIRAKFIKIQFNIESLDTPYSVYSFSYRTIENGYM